MICRRAVAGRKELIVRKHDTLITDVDHRRLRSLVTRLRADRRGRKDEVAALNRRLRRAGIVSRQEIPRNVVTLNSCFVMKDLDSRNRLFCTLADSSDIPAFGNRLSVAAPAGIAVLGKRVGQIVSWTLGPKVRRLRIEQILYQPEAAGDEHL
jgi:regulator of nucleoside diphosphate kinase